MWLKISVDTEESGSEDLQVISSPPQSSAVGLSESEDLKFSDALQHPDELQETPKPSSKLIEELKTFQQKRQESTKTVEVEKPAVEQETKPSAPAASNGEVTLTQKAVEVQKKVESVAVSNTSVQSENKLHSAEKEKTVCVTQKQVDNFCVGVQVNVEVDDMSRKYTSGLSSSSRAG